MVGFGCCGEEVKLPGELYASLEEGGYLDENGICHFDEENVAYPSGMVTIPGFWLQNPSDSEIEKAIEAGWIKFIDGNGDKKKAMTREQYIAKYPNYWPPDLVLRMTGRLPPRKFIKIGRA